MELNINLDLVNWLVYVLIFALFFSAFAIQVKNRWIRSIASLFMILSVGVVVYANFWNLGKPYPVIYDVFSRSEKSVILSYHLEENVGIYLWLRPQNKSKIPLYISRPWSVEEAKDIMEKFSEARLKQSLVFYEPTLETATAAQYYTEFPEAPRPKNAPKLAPIETPPG